MNNESVNSKRLAVELTDIHDKNYSEVWTQLKDCPDCSQNINTQQCSMTGLEYSVWDLDWKMFLVFFFAGTSPEQNKFDGIIHTTGSLLDDDAEPRVIEAFRDEPKPGFQGLELILSEAGVVDNEDATTEIEQMKATLWLTRFLWEGPSDFSRTSVETVRQNCDLLGADFNWEEHYKSRARAFASRLAVLGRALETLETESMLRHGVEILLRAAIQDCLKGILEREGIDV